MPRRAALVPVELVEDSQPEPTTPTMPVRRSRRPLLWLLVPVVAVAVLAGAQQVSEAMARAADARVAALPGAIDPLGDGIDVVWRSDPIDLPLAYGLVAQGALHGVVVGPDGSLTYRSVDLATGAERWSADLRGPDPALVDPLNTTRTRCQPWGADLADPTQVVCLVTDVYLGQAGTGEAGRVASQSRLRVLDLADGQALADRAIAPVGSMAVLPGLVATGTVDAANHLLVLATDPLTGAELWRYRGAGPLLGATPPPPDVAGLGGLVFVATSTADSPMLLSATGERIPVDAATNGWAGTEQGWLTLQRLEAGRNDPVTTVYRPGEPPVEVDGTLLDRSVDDGSVPGLEVSTGQALYGWDTRTGARRWEADVDVAPVFRPSVLVIEGVVYVAGFDDIVALDARTGDVRWTFPRQVGSYRGELLTDGAHILLVDAPSDGVGTGYVTIVDRRDGTFVHRLALPAGVRDVFSAGRRLVDAGSQEIAGLG